MKKIKLVESDLGRKCTEALARRIDREIKSLPKTDDYSFRTKTILNATSEFNQGERTDVSYVSTRLMDRQYEIVLPDAFELDEYRMNPVVLFDHCYDKPVGMCKWIKVNDNGLIAKTWYPPRPKKFVGEFFTDKIWALVSCDPPVLKGKSVGYLPLEIRDPTTEELQESPDLLRVVTRCLLVEYSVVTVPCNSHSLVQAVQKGLDCSCLGSFGVVKPVPEKKMLKVKPKEFRIDSDRIAEKAVQAILKRWDV